MSMAKVKVEKDEVMVRDTLKNNRGRGGGSRRGHISTVKFTGNCTSFFEHVYDIGHGQANHYMKTTEVIPEYVEEEYTHGSYIRLNNEMIEVPTIIEPAEEATKDVEGNVSRLSEFMWQEEARDFVKTYG